MGVSTFKCGNCGRIFTMDTAKLPPTGARGLCQSCSEPIAIYPDGRVQGAVLVTQGARGDSPESAAVHPPQASAPVSPPAVSGKTSFYCPSCGHRHEADLSKVPAAGGRGKCAGCGVLLILKPDGSVSLAEATPPSGEGAPPAGERAPDEWYLKQGEDSVGPFTAKQLSELIQNGRLTPESTVKQGNGAWGAAGSAAILAEIFAEKDAEVPESEEPYGNEDQCYSHPERVPVRRCVKCQRYLCQECLTPLKGGGPTPLLVCPVCGGTTMILKRREKWTPFYMDIGQILSAPVKGSAFLYFGFLTLLEILKIPCHFAGLLGLVGVIILASMQWVFFIHVVRSVANGSYEVPDWPDSSDVWEMVGVFLKVLLVTIISLLPVMILACVGGMGMSIMSGLMGTSTPGVSGMVLVILVLAGFFYLFYLPICIAIVALFQTVVPALNPIIIFRIMERIGKPYLYAVGLWGSLLVINRVITRSLLHLGLGGKALVAPLGVYTILLFCYVLGRVCYENEPKIGWQ